MLPLDRLSSLTRRHRRGLAALLAGAGVLFALGSLRGAPGVPVTDLADTAPTLRTGEVAVPVTLASSAIAAVLSPGDVVDLVAAPDAVTSDPTVLAVGARVLDSAASAGFGASASAVVLLAVPREAALDVSTSIDRTLTVIVRSG